MLRAARARRTPHLKAGRKHSPLSTLPRCGVCGYNMSLAGLRHGSRAFACSANRSKGTCPNGHSIQEGKLLRFLGEIVHKTLENEYGAEALYEAFVQEVDRQTNAKSRLTPRPNLKALDAAVRKAKANRSRVAEVMLSYGRASDELRTRLDNAEAEVTRCQAARSSADSVPQALPNSSPWKGSPRVGFFAIHLRAVWANIGKLFEGVGKRDPLWVRAELSKRMGRVTLTPRETPQGVVWTLQTDLSLGAGPLVLKPGDTPPSRGRRGVRQQAIAGAGFEPATFGL